MSSKRRDERAGHAPPASRIPVNTDGMAFYRIEEIEVASWCPLPDGKGPATQVHLAVRVRGFPHPLVMRFKGPVGLDAFIDTLERHRYDVWPSGSTTHE